MFIQLREKKSLAYSVAPIGFEGLEPGYLGIYIGTSPTKKDEALKGIQSVLEGVMKTPPSKKELLRAKEYYLGRRAMDLQSDSALSAYMGLYCLYHDSAPRDEITDIEKIEAKDIQRVCEDYFLKPHQVTCVVG